MCTLGVLEGCRKLFPIYIKGSQIIGFRLMCQFLGNRAIYALHITQGNRRPHVTQPCIPSQAGRREKPGQAI